jgi:hypothetical protein
MTLYKDEALDRLARSGNVAQFIAFRPRAAGGLDQTTARVAGCQPNERFAGVREAAAALLSASAERTVNVRSYQPDDPHSREFVYGIGSVDEVVGHLDRLGAQGLHLIINETVDVSDGGVSGVAQGDVIEFAPDDTPRAVEKPGAASLPRDMGLSILHTVYGFAPDLPGAPEDRVEFSIHPTPRGWRGTHTLLWEIEEGAGAREARPARWPNRFSRHVGDKAFGLLVADQLGLPVPSTTVIGRRVAPFSFGQPTGSNETWLRTAPREPEPGLFTTTRGWRDPFTLLAVEDPDGHIAAVIAQAGVRAAWSGAAIVSGDQRIIVEGRRGEGDLLMLGEALPEALPSRIEADVCKAHTRLSEVLGPVRIEWVHDGDRVWIVQLHVGATGTTSTVVVGGEADCWIEFDAPSGLVGLRALLDAAPAGAGVAIKGDVGLTSHIADLLRKAGRPARMIQG